MTRFLDGPAEGQTMLLRNAPLVLRAVQGPDGRWDALDMPTDQPAPHEAVVLYERVSAAGFVHVRASKGGGFYASADYRVRADQLDDAIVRNQPAWRAWLTDEINRLMP